MGILTFIMLFSISTAFLDSVYAGDNMSGEQTGWPGQTRNDIRISNMVGQMQTNAEMNAQQLYNSQHGTDWSPPPMPRLSEQAQHPQRSHVPPFFDRQSTTSLRTQRPSEAYMHKLLQADMQALRLGKTNHAAANTGFPNRNSRPETSAEIEATFKMGFELRHNDRSRSTSIWNSNVRAFLTKEQQKRAERGVKAQHDTVLPLDDVLDGDLLVAKRNGNAWERPSGYRQNQSNH